MFADKYKIHVRKYPGDRQKIDTVVVTKTGMITKGLTIDRVNGNFQMKWKNCEIYGDNRLKICNSGATISHFVMRDRFYGSKQNASNVAAEFMSCNLHKPPIDPVIIHGARMVWKMAGIKHNPYQEQDEWLVRYFAIALRCGSPVLEALMIARDAPVRQENIVTFYKK
jgi:hypothetical protein